MDLKFSSLLIFLIFALTACAQTDSRPANNAENKASANDAGKGESSVINGDSKDSTKISDSKNSENPENGVSQIVEPKTVREFFNFLPEKYFALEGCDKAKDKNCSQARAAYLKTYLETDDAKNGYLKAGCDGAQSCITVALFKRPDASYVVHVLTEHEGGESSYFLDYKNGKWADIGAGIVPEYSQKNTYVPPRVGTTVEVFKKNFPEPEFSERGAKVYDLIWREGKFEKK